MVSAKSNYVYDIQKALNLNKKSYNSDKTR